MLEKTKLNKLPTASQILVKKCKLNCSIAPGKLET